MKIELFRHNEAAYESAAAMMEEAGRAAVVHPTGTGKSFIAFRLCLDHEDKRICWLSPSEYIWKTQLENLEKAAGCIPRNVTFYTYSKLILMTDDEFSAIAPDCIVLDEFHRCGARVWQKAIARLMALFPDARVLGLSATAIRYLDNRRNMAQELFAGHIASYMSLGEAIVRGILRQPVYVLSRYEYEDLLASRREEIRRCRSRAAKDAAQQYYDALRRALEKADHLDVIFARHMKEKDGKYIVFCSSRQHMEQMIEKAPEWFAGVDREPHIYRTSYSNPRSEKEFRSFREDESSHLKLLFCIDMLNEGIHVEDVSGVILLRPTVSPIIYRQQIGRALSSGSGRTPVIFDVVMNIDNLCSIDAIEEEMAQSTSYLRAEGREDEIINDRFRLMDELGDCRRLFRKLDEVLAATWDQMYEAARRYHAANGHLNVPKRYVTEEGYTLGSWISVQRRIYSGKAAGVMDEVRADKLEQIGMVWDDPWEASWDRHFSAAEEYYETFGDLLVPAEYETPDGLFLGRWIGRLRARRKAGSFPSYLKEE